MADLRFDSEDCQGMPGDTPADAEIRAVELARDSARELHSCLKRRIVRLRRHRAGTQQGEQHQDDDHVIHLIHLRLISDARHHAIDQPAYPTR